MQEAFTRWSEQSLGQWHYVLGYTITLVSHNWPVMLALGLGAFLAYCAYRWPSRLTVCWLLTALLIGLTYEYQKHVAGELHQAIDMLFGREIAGWNGPLHQLVGPVARAALVLGCAVMLGQSLRLTALAAGSGPKEPTTDSGPKA